MIYGYLRGSSDEQDVNSQKQGVEKFAEAKGWTIEEYITDEGVSGGKDPDKRNLGPLLKKIKKDDVIIASEISRLGRDLYMVMDILHFCMERECVIYTVKDNFTLGTDIQSKVLAFAFGLSAEIERNLISMRTKEALARLKAEGRRLGRPPGEAGEESLACFPYKDKIWMWHDQGMSLAKIAKKLKLGEATVCKYYNKYIAEENDL